jgi:hypothetical protein
MSGTHEPGKGKRAPGTPPVSDKVRAKIRKLARLGTMSQSQVARECGVSRSTVVRVCAAAGIHFDRSGIAPAIEARGVDLKAHRLKLSERTVTEALSLFDKLHAEHEVHHFDKDGIVSWATLKGPTSSDVKNYAIAIGILLQRHADLIKIDSDARDLPAVELWLAQVMGTNVPDTVPAEWV